MPRFLVVLDVDSTLIEDEVIDQVAARIGVADRVAEITARAMAGELDFAGSLRERVGLLAGLPVAELEEVRASLTVTRGVPELIAGVHAAGGMIGAVSGGFNEVLDPLAAELGLDRWRANRFGAQDDRLTGLVAGDIVDGAAKAATLLGWAQESGVPLSRTIAIGDGANDIPMLQQAGLGIAFDAKPRTRAAADLALPVRDLSAVLAVLGLR